MPELAFVNGRILPLDQATVPIEDRGYQFGDAVYEVIASSAGRLFALEEHLDRLERSLGELHFSKVSRDEVHKAILELFVQADIADALVYLQISRGVAPRLHQFPEQPTPQLIMTVRAKPSGMPEKRAAGVSVVTMTDFRWGRCDIKTVQLLPNVLCKQAALDAGVYDAIFVTDQGVVREATSSNVFVVKDGEAITHPLTQNILPGITRAIVLGICNEIGQPAREAFYKLENLLFADEVFLSGTGAEVLPVVEVDGRVIGTGKPGPISLRLLDELLARM